MKVDHLPDEVIGEIISFIPTETLIHDISFLSTKWFNLISNTNFLTQRCLFDNFSKYCQQNLKKQIIIANKLKINTGHPICSQLKRLYFQLSTPTKLMKFHTDFKEEITISKNGRIVKIHYSHDNDKDPYDSDLDDDRITQTSSPFNKKLDVYYFEVYCSYVKKGSCFSVGVSKPNVDLFQQLGWQTGSIGYHGDDGYLYVATLNEGQKKLEKYGKGDVIGCGILKDKLFFTKNGKFLSFVALLKKSVDYHPSISTWRSGRYEVNFGEKEFKFDIETLKLDEIEEKDLELVYDSDDMVDDEDDEYETDEDYFPDEEDGQL
jgi:hypothetical protein